MTKKILITGGGSGIGYATAKIFLNNGFQVIIAGRCIKKLKESYNNLNDSELAFYNIDFSKFDDVKLLSQKLGNIGTIIHCAGVNIPNRKIRNLTSEDWQTVIENNLSSAFNLIKCFLPNMQLAKDGHFIFISSIAGITPKTSAGAAYSASKHALNALCTILANQEKENKIRSTLICPGEVNTDFLNYRAIPPTKEHRQLILQPDDIAEIIYFTAALPKHACIREIIITPTIQEF